MPLYGIGVSGYYRENLLYTFTLSVTSSGGLIMQKEKNRNTAEFSALKNIKGNALVLMVIVLPAMIGISGLVLDWGRGVWVRTQLQAAADAGALAGASDLDELENALVGAETMVNSNFNSPDDENYPASGNQFTVELTENVPTFFMGLFGQDTMEVGVTATAVGIRPVGGIRGGGFPIAIINPELNSDPSDDLTEWNYGRPYIIGYGEDNIMVQDWANGSDPPPPNPGGGNSMGWRGFIGLDDDGTIGNCGASDIKNNMEFGWPGILRIGDEVPTVEGNMASASKLGREAMLGDNPIDWEDFDIEEDARCSRIALVPIIHLIHETRGDTYTIQDFNNGADWDKSAVIIDGFAPFFILAQGEYEQYLDVNGNTHDWILGYFIPGLDTSHFVDPGYGNPDYGLFSQPRLID